jgi:hypothetical protein
MLKHPIAAGLLALSLLMSGWVMFHRELVVKSEDLGASSGPFSPNATNLNLGGVNIKGKAMSLATGTSTVCAIQSPAATSTLLSAGVRFKLASTSATVVDFGKSSTRYSTTTRIGSAYAVAASAQATIVASSTGSVAGDATIFAPNQWFVAKYSDNGNGVGNASTGSCYATFVSM